MIITDQGTAFTSQEFQTFCQRENIQHHAIVTGIPRGNGQVERVNRTLIPMMTKLSMPHAEQWYKFVGIAQQYYNHAPCRSTGFSPFFLQFGVKMRLKEDLRVQEILEEETLLDFQEKRCEHREKAHAQIKKMQEENKKSYNRKRKAPHEYEKDDIVAIQRTQGGPGLKFRAKYLGPYKVTKVLRNDRYIVEKIGNGEGPRTTSTASDHMKQWSEFEEN